MTLTVYSINGVTPVVDPTAYVHPSAVLIGDVIVGANCYIGPCASLRGDFGRIDVRAGANLQDSCVAHGFPGTDTVVAEDGHIGHGAIIGVPPQDISFSLERKTKVEIGDDNIIREYCTIHRGSPDGSATKMGDKNFLMSGAHIGHNCLIGNNVVIANNCLLAGHVRVDDGAFLGGGSTFHQFMHIGRLVMVQGSSAFGKDLPPFVVAAERNCVFGLNIVGMRRAGLSANDRDEIKEAFKLIYLSGLNTSQALEKAETMSFGAPAREFLNFVATSKKRGICPLKRGEADDVSV